MSSLHEQLNRATQVIKSLELQDVAQKRRLKEVLEENDCLTADFGKSQEELLISKAVIPEVRRLQDVWRGSSKTARLLQRN